MNNSTANIILSTKVNIPPLWRENVSRPRLIEILDQGLARKLLLVAAPAGYGKTTLLSDWVQQVTIPVAWLSLDQRDNDLTRFLTYVIAALQTIAEGFAAATLEGLHSSPAPQSESILTGLINEIALISDPMVLVLDDYHEIEYQPIHEAVSFLVEHLPPQMHIVLSSRIDPPLPLARWRGRGQLAELREAHLRFTTPETNEFFKRTMSLNLQQGDLEALASHTEGWIAGLQLAAISIKNRSDVSAFVAEFSGSHEFIVDYLTDEVLEKTPAALRDFLLQTSILSRLSGQLCDQVTGRQDGKATLEFLRANHLFLMPLDDERRWFRYHALFADLLRKRLLEAQPELVPALYLRASHWFDRNGDPEQAIQHAFAAKDYEKALAIIERIAEATLVRSEFRTFLKWMETIPPEMIRSRPRLLVYYASALLFSGDDPETVETLLNEAVKADESEEIQGEAAAMHAMIATLKGDVGRSIERSQHAIEALPAGNLFLRSLVIGNLCFAYISTGDVEAAGELFARAARDGEQAGNHMATVMALRRLAEIALLQGDLHRAWDICERGLRLAVYPSGKPLPVAGILMALQGDILREWNDLQSANEHIQIGIELVLRWSELAAIENYLYQARVKRSLGDAQGAQSAIDTARQISEKNRVSRVAPFIITLFQARLWLQLGKLSEVETWARNYQPFEDFLEGQGYNPKYHHHMLEIEGIAFARFHLAGGRWDRAFEILEPLHKAATELKRTGSLIEILILKAITSLKEGDNDRAMGSLERALSLAEPQGYMRMFIDEGQPMRDLLHLFLEEAHKRESSEPVSSLIKYVNQLLAALAAETVTRRVTREDASAGLTEPLSPRELEVLRFLGTSLTSTEIAGELFISPNTARFHIKNIYSKLGVHRRVDAVERARQLGLL